MEAGAGRAERSRGRPRRQAPLYSPSVQMSISLLLCVVLAVPDGDSLRARCERRAKPVTVRVLRIDAPELPHPGFWKAEQPFARESRANLLALCLGKPARVHRKGLDRYRRTLATVECDGKDVASAQVAAGMAWVHLPPARSPLPALEAGARDAKRGLWSGSPVAPWEWRKHPT